MQKRCTHWIYLGASERGDVLSVRTSRPLHLLFYHQNNLKRFKKRRR